MQKSNPNHSIIFQYHIAMLILANREVELLAKVRVIL